MRSRGYGKMSHGLSGNSSTRSQTGDADVPLGGITVSQDLKIQVEERDDLSQKSFASTKNLTALPNAEQNDGKRKSEWIEGCRTVCAALSRDASRSRSTEKDLERGSPER